MYGAPAVRIEQPQPQPDRLRTVTRPVIGRDQTGGKIGAFTEKGQIGGKVQPVQIRMPDRKHVGRQAYRFQRVQRGCARQERGQARAHGYLAEIKRPDRAYRALVQIRHGLQHMSRAVMPNTQRIMRIDPRHREGTGQQRQQCIGHAMRVIQRHRPDAGQLMGQSSQLLRRQRMCQRLVGGVAT